MPAQPRRPRVLACLDNRTGYEVLRFLLSQGEAEVVGVITHPARTALYGEEIASVCEAVGIPRWDIEEARRRFGEALAPLAPDFLVSIYFDYILDQRFLDLPARDAINLHPGYLPYNKGFYYYVWAVLDGTPAGVSIHRMFADVDAGDVISQLRVKVEPTDDGETLYRKHEDASLELFRATWPPVAQGTAASHRQRHGGTRHKLAEVRALTRIDPREPLAAVDLIDRLRACSFPGKSGCTIELGGKTYRIHLSLEEVAREEEVKLPGKLVG